MLSVLSIDIMCVYAKGVKWVSVQCLYKEVLCLSSVHKNAFFIKWRNVLSGFILVSALTLRRHESIIQKSY